MLMLLTSPKALGDTPDENLVNVLSNLKADGNPVAIVSNHDKPSWFDESFKDKGVQFVTQRGRQNGEIISHNAKNFGLKPYDTIVLAACNEDVQMGKNGNAVLVAAGWITDDYIKSLGIRVNNPQELQEVIKLTSSWNGQWWYSGGCTSYNVKSLADLSTYGKTHGQTVFAEKLKNTVKTGGSNLNSLLAVTARSLIMDGVVSNAGLVWGVYPSSASNNNDTEVLSDFTHRLRTTTSRVQFAKKDIPLFIRHTKSAKRSAGGGGDRTDPSGQIETIHVNPHYRGKLNGKHVIVIDDCTTYGVSFGVASALLKKAGASKVTGVALGKFGSQLRYYDITIEGDVFSPIKSFEYKETRAITGSTNSAAQQDLTTLVN